MVLTKKFSEFTAINKSGVNQLVGLSAGANAISDLPINWTTALRPVAPTNGFSGYNTSLSQWEYWNATTSSWVQLSGGGAGTVTLVVAGAGLTGGSITTIGTIALDIPVTVPHGGTGVTSIASYAVICGGTTSANPLQTVSGLGTNGQVLTSSGAGSLPTWQDAPGSGSVNAGLINEMAYYASSGSVISGLATAANGVLITSAGSVPSISTSLPVTVQGNITALGTIASGVWNGTGITVPFGGTGNSTFTAYSVICAGATATGAFQNVSGLGAAGEVLTSNGAGGLPTWQSVAGTGTVAAGLQNQLAYYAANGTTVSGLATAANGVLITSAGSVPSISSTLPSTVQLNITSVGTIGTGVWQGTPIALLYGGTNAALTASLGGIFYSTATAGAILSGTATARQMLQSGASAAPAWSTATWPATTSINRILYSSAANTVSEITTAANGVLLTDVTGVPSIGTTLPSTVQTNITALGVVATGTWNATAITVPHGGTGNTTFTAFSVICAGTTATGTFQNVSGVGLLGQFLMSNGAGALPSWANVSGSGTVNSGNANEIAYYAAGGTTVSGLTTANGGVLVTSNTGQPSILVGSGTTGTILQATSGAAPAWSTATYPATTTINQLLYSSSANVIAGVTSANSGAVVTTSAGVPTIIAAGTTGQVLQASTAGTPAWSTPTYPTTSGTARKILVSDATNNVYSTETWAVPGSANNTLVSNGTNWIALATNPVIQQVRTISGSVATGSTTLPIDNTIPQSGEGDQYLTLAITPKNTANVLKIDISMFFARATTAGNTAVALFQDSTANALAAGMFNSAISIASECGFTYYMAAGTTSATTFKVRAGNGLGNTTTFNGNAGSAFMGGVLASTIIITEYAL